MPGKKREATGETIGTGSDDLSVACGSDDSGLAENLTSDVVDKQGGVEDGESALVSPEKKRKGSEEYVDSEDSADSVKSTEPPEAKSAGTSRKPPKGRSRRKKVSASKSEKFFMLNLKACNYEMFNTKVAASAFKAKFVKHFPMAEEHLVIESFSSEAAAKRYVAAVAKMSTAVGPALTTLASDAGPEHGQPSASSTQAIINQGVAASAAPPVSQAVVLQGVLTNPVLAGNHQAAGFGSELPEDPIVDDDDVPFEAAASADPGNPAMLPSFQTGQMSAHAAACFGYGTSISVLRWILPGCDWHVYAWKLMDGNNEQYWSHKPQMWMHSVQSERIAPLYDAGPNGVASLHRTMSRWNAAAIRSVPFGENKVQTIETKRNHKTIDQYLLYGLCRAADDNTAIGARIKSFTNACTNRESIRDSYASAVKARMPSEVVQSDTSAANGKYWIKLAAASNQIAYREMRHLSEIFLDQDIVSIVNLAYNTRGLAVSMWRAEVRSYAFGPVVPQVL
jgi:hypothetical protein